MDHNNSSSVTSAPEHNYEEQDVKRSRVTFLLKLHSFTFLQFSFWFTDLRIWIWAGQKLCSECFGL